MKWFKSGLTEAELKAEYRRLVKEHHPDLNGSSKESNKIMLEINREFDDYFVGIKQEKVGVNWEDLFSRYAKARKEREAILHFMSYDKCPDFDVGRESGGWFTLGSWYGMAIKQISDNGPEWNNFHGGFALTQAYGEYGRMLKKIPAKIECPTTKDMYFAMVGQAYNQPSTEMQTAGALKTARAYVSEYGHYQLVRTKKRGCMWIEPASCCGGSSKSIQAFMKVNGLVMSSFVPQHVIKDADVLETYSGEDFAYHLWQECSKKDFMDYHDVNYTPQFANALGCKKLSTDALWWIDNPVVAHFARNGVLEFYESGENFRMRYGSFNSSALKEHLHELSIDDAEEIQDFLDEINREFEEYVKRLIKRGKLRIVV